MPLQKNRYLSILKQKAGEVDAVRDLSSNVWDRWNPLFELLSGELDEEEKPADLVSRLVHGIKRSCRPAATVFLDFEKVDLPNSGGDVIVSEVLNQLTVAGYSPVPVVKVSNSPQVRTAFKAFLQSNGGCASLRIYLGEITPELSQQVSKLVSELDIAIPKSFLLIDLEEIPGNYIQQLTVILPGLFGLVPALAEWSSVTLIGTGVPHVLGIPSRARGIRSCNYASQSKNLLHDR